MNRRILVALAALALVSKMEAQERIISYNSQIDVRADGSLDVTEMIKVHAEGNQIRRGIYRDFPTRYEDRFGNRVRVDLQVLGVQRNDVTEPWFTESMTNGVRINTGNDSFLPVPADYTYTFHYRTTRQLGFFSDHDEIYWNAIGTGWVFPIESATVVVHLPSPVPVASMHAEGYTGRQGAKGAAYQADLPEPGVARYRLTEGLGPYEGLTIVLTFPKGLIHEPTQSERTQWLLKDNRGVLVALAGFILALVYMVRQWQRVGRDPQKGIVIARYEPRDGQSPAGLRYMENMGYDMRCFTGDVLALAVAGRLTIHKEDHFLGDEWSLERSDAPSSSKLSPGQQTLLAGLFPGGENTLLLKNTNAAIVGAARDAQRKVLQKEFQPEFFRLNGGKIGWAFLILLLTGILAFISSGGFGIPFIIALMGLGGISLVVFARLIRAPTLEGRKLLDEIEGFKLYMKVAEKQELASMRGPDEPVLDAKRYEALLPFAVALGVEDAWTKKFTAAAGAAAAAEAANNMGWYYGRGPISNLGSFSSEIGHSLSSSISSASTPPGSSSGGGGGGSSGGGGGGGGGGGR